MNMIFRRMMMRRLEKWWVWPGGRPGKETSDDFLLAPGLRLWKKKKRLSFIVTSRSANDHPGSLGELSYHPAPSSPSSTLRIEGLPSSSPSSSPSSPSPPSSPSSTLRMGGGDPEEESVRMRGTWDSWAMFHLYIPPTPTPSPQSPLPLSPPSSPSPSPTHSYPSWYVKRHRDWLKRNITWIFVSECIYVWQQVHKSLHDVHMHVARIISACIFSFWAKYLWVVSQIFGHIFSTIGPNTCR